MDPDTSDRLIIHHQLKAMVADPDNSPKPEEQALTFPESEEEESEEELSEGSEEEAESEEESSEGSEEETIKPELSFESREGVDNYPDNKYGKISCKCCQKLRERQFKPKDDDCNYLQDKDDFDGDEQLKLSCGSYITGGRSGSPV
ncbi:unnamed protein product [Linum trigynum]|uniref:Uncharacterized protein n=1 Tax=Linum trigynum TaxID=586398 RepID=A0AAV2DS25_9ROSI